MSISQKLFETSFPEWWFGPKVLKALSSMVVGQKVVLHKGKNVAVKLQWDRNDRKYLAIHVKQMNVSDKDGLPYWNYRKYEIVSSSPVTNLGAKDRLIKTVFLRKDTGKVLKFSKSGKYVNAFANG